jgi:AraC-like DNA-binding protein
MSRITVPDASLPFCDLRFTTAPQFFYWGRDYHWLPPPLSDYDLWFIMEGRGSVHLRGTSYVLRPGCCFVLVPGDRPAAHHDPAHPLTAFFCHFHLLDRRGRRISPRRLVVPPPAMQAHDLGLLTSLAQRCVAAYRRGDELGRRQSRVVLEDMLLLMWEWGVVPPAEPGDAQINEIMQSIEKEPGRDWSVAEIARMAHLSRSQLTRRFIALTGIPPMRYVIRARLHTARQLLRETNMKLEQIAEELGYSDLCFLSRQFRQHFGVPPSALRLPATARDRTPTTPGRMRQ